MQRVLVIRIGRLGDTLLATPVIEALRQACGPGVKIDFAASPGASAYILELDERVNRVFPIAHRSTPWRLHRVKRALERHSREFPYDLVINLECGHECDDFIRFARHDKFLGRPLVETQHREDRHCVDTEKSIYAEFLGRNISRNADTSLKLKLETQQLPVPVGVKYLVINPGFSGLGRAGYRSHRAWPESHWVRLVELIRKDTGWPVLVNGTAAEQAFFPGLLEAPGVHSLMGSSLPTLVQALSGAQCLVSVDTGTMHLATALATPVVALFGPTNPQLTGPYSIKDANRVLVSGVDCQPCVNTAAQRKCTLNRCMTGLSPEVVYDACLQVVSA